MQTIYVSEPSNIHDAWANLHRLLSQVKALFSLTSDATDYGEAADLHQAAGLGLELTEEAERRAETLRDFVKNYTREKTTVRKED